MSPAWIAMAREQILRGLDGKDSNGIRFTLCEEFTNPSEHLRRSGAQTIGFYVRLRDLARIIGFLPMVYVVWWKRNIYLGMIVHCLGNTAGALGMLALVFAR